MGGSVDVARLPRKTGILGGGLRGLVSGQLSRLTTALNKFGFPFVAPAGKSQSDFIGDLVPFAEGVITMTMFAKMDYRFHQSPHFHW